MSVPATTATTHREIAGFIAPIDEFQGHNDDCGPYAIMAALRPFDSATYPFDAHTLNTIRQEMIDHKEWVWGSDGKSHGCNVDHIASYLRRHGYGSTVFSSYGEGGKFDLATFHDTLRMYAGVKPIIFEPSQAYHLPGNEAGTLYHWVTVGGLDSTEGYLVANGDELPYTGLRWIGWPSFEACVPVAYLVVEPPAAHDPPPPPPPPPAESDDSQADAAVVAADQQLQQTLEQVVFTAPNVAAFKAQLTAASVHAKALYDELIAAINSLPS